MPLTPATVLRSIPASGNSFAVLEDGSNRLYQAVALIDDNGNVLLPAQDNTVAAQAAFYTGSCSVGVTAVQMFAAGQALVKGVTIKSSVSNAGVVYVGGSTAVTAGTASTTDGMELAPGESLVLEVNNLNLVWLIASAASQQVFFTGV